MAVVVQPLGYLYKIKIGEVVIYCKQLSYRVRSTIGATYQKQQSGTEVQNALGLLFEVLRHSIKRVEGFENPDGSEFELVFENDILTEECLDQLMYVEGVGDVLQLCASNFIHMKSASKILDAVTGLEIEGVSVEKVEDSKKK